MTTGDKMSYSRIKRGLTSSAQGTLIGFAGGTIKDGGFFLAEKSSYTLADTVILLAIGKFMTGWLISEDQSERYKEKLSQWLLVKILNNLTSYSPTPNKQKTNEDKTKNTLSILHFLCSLAEHVAAGSIGYFLFKLMHAKFFPETPCLSYNQMLFNTIAGAAAVKLCDNLIDDLSEVKNNFAKK